MSTHHPSASDATPFPATSASRRAFLKNGALTALAAGALGACKENVAVAQAKPTGAMDHTGGTSAPAARAASAPLGLADARERADEMDAMHEKGMKAFPAATKGKGNVPLAPTVVGGVKVFELTARPIRWEVEPGRLVEAWAYNDQVPGPQIRVREGDRVRVMLKNELPESTVIHFHGLELPNALDGVPFVTQPPVKPGESYAYEFVVPNSGSHMYHSHHNSAKQVGLGLLGAFLVEPRDPKPIERADVDYVMILNDGMHGYTLNGKSFPATEPIVAKLGQKVRIRFMNEGMMIHPMHLHGMHMTVIAKDGWEQPAPWKCDTLHVAPGDAARSRHARPRPRPRRAPPLFQPPPRAMIDDIIRVILADDHAVVRAGLKAVLGSAKDVQVVGEASNGREAVAMVERLNPHVVVVDLTMPEMDGVAAAKAFAARQSASRDLVLTMHAEDEYLVPLLEAGASGYRVKIAADRELVAAVRAVAHGDTYVQPSAARALAGGVRRRAEHADDRDRFEHLTDGQRDVLRLVARGFSAPEIGEQLFISPKTVDTYKQRIGEKLGLTHRSEYVQFALKLGLLQD